MTYLIDIVGTCNLKCPSCPVGNFEDGNFLEEKRPKGFMEFDLFQKIIKKIKEQCSPNTPYIMLYNWGEALIHPRIVEFLEFIGAAGCVAEISTNLSMETDLRGIVKAQKGQIIGLRISLSGFYQPVYEKGHRSGKIALVKSNMHRLRHYMDLYKKTIPVHVYYHVYRDNAGEDLLMMASLCRELGFGFLPAWAYFMPLEKVLDYLNVDRPRSQERNRTLSPIPIGLTETSIQKELLHNDADVIREGAFFQQVEHSGREGLSQDDLELIGRLVMPIEKMIELAKNAHVRDCALRSSQTVINYDGSVPLCCTTYDPAFVIAESFLNTSAEDLQKAKYSHSLCDTCMKNHLHKVFQYQPASEWDRACNEELGRVGIPHAISMFSMPKISNRLS